MGQQTISKPAHNVRTLRIAEDACFVSADRLAVGDVLIRALGTGDFDSRVLRIEAPADDALIYITVRTPYGVASVAPCRPDSLFSVRKLSGDMRRAIRVAVHQQLRGA